MGERFAGRVAIVTGGGGGVGRATALRLAAEGACVTVADIVTDTAADSVAAVEAAGGTALAVEVDVSDEEQVRHMVAATVERFGRLDILHNNAAALGDVHQRDLDVVDLDVEVWDRAMAVNARGIMLGCKHAVPAMRASEPLAADGGGGGVIVNTASVSALVGADVNAAYGSSKAAVVALTRYVATMYGAEGIRCNAVAPGLILSDIAKQALSERQMAERACERLLPWAAEPEEIAGVVCWLASDEARGITGQTLVVDSGITAHRPIHAMKSWERTLTSADE
jgi:NAD(P)-dependent dehydrogenase (short-subunit alcohol dehydrogenase family)